MTIKLITERTHGLFLGARGISDIPIAADGAPPTTRIPPRDDEDTSDVVLLYKPLFIIIFLRIFHRHRLTVYTIHTHCRH